MTKVSALDKIRAKYKGNIPKKIYYSEAEVQKSVILFYEKDGWFVVKIIQTTRNGWPDIQCHKNGTTIFIECKATGEKPAPLQLYIHNKLIDFGFKVLVIDNKM